MSKRHEYGTNGRDKVGVYGVSTMNEFKQGVRGTSAGMDEYKARVPEAGTWDAWIGPIQRRQGKGCRQLVKQTGTRRGRRAGMQCSGRLQCKLEAPGEQIDREKENECVCGRKTEIGEIERKKTKTCMREENGNRRGNEEGISKTRSQQMQGASARGRRGARCRGRGPRDSSHRVKLDYMRRSSGGPPSVER